MISKKHLFKSGVDVHGCYLVAVVGHWLSDAGKNQQLLTLHCRSCSTNQPLLS